MNPSPYPAPFNSAHVRAGIVKVVLIVGAVVTGLSIVFEALSLAFPEITDEQDVADNPASAIILFVLFLIALLSIAVYLATVVFFLIWLYRAHGNLRRFTSRPLDYSPGWAVGSFFIPFANLVIPYRAVREVWQKSGPPDEALLSEPGPPALFPAWWTFWLLSSFAGNISMRLSFNENVPRDSATMVSIFAGVLSIVAAVCAYLVVDSIDKRQEETRVKLNLGQPAGPPPPPASIPMSDVITPAP